QSNHRPLLLILPPFFLFLPPRPPRSTLFPYTTLFRSLRPREQERPLPATLAVRDPVGDELVHGLTLADLTEVEHNRPARRVALADRKSTRLNSSHVAISYAVFCLKKKKRNPPRRPSSG